MNNMNDFSYNVTTIGNNSLKNSEVKNDDNIQNTDTININEEMESENKIKEENYNPEINFEIKLKNEPISNRSTKCLYRNAKCHDTKRYEEIK